MSEDAYCALQREHAHWRNFGKKGIVGHPDWLHAWTQEISTGRVTSKTENDRHLMRTGRRLNARLTNRLPCTLPSYPPLKLYKMLSEQGSRVVLPVVGHYPADSPFAKPPALPASKSCCASM
jgi:hypothetical protein